MGAGSSLQMDPCDVPASEVSTWLQLRSVGELSGRVKKVATEVGDLARKTEAHVAAPLVDRAFFSKCWNRINPKNSRRFDFSICGKKSASFHEMLKKNHDLRKNRFDNNGPNHATRTFSRYGILSCEIVSNPLNLSAAVRGWYHQKAIPTAVFDHAHPGSWITTLHHRANHLNIHTYVRHGENRATSTPWG